MDMELGWVHWIDTWGSYKCSLNVPDKVSPCFHIMLDGLISSESFDPELDQQGFSIYRELEPGCFSSPLLPFLFSLTLNNLLSAI